MGIDDNDTDLTKSWSVRLTAFAAAFLGAAALVSAALKDGGENQNNETPAAEDVTVSQPAYTTVEPPELNEKLDNSL